MARSARLADQLSKSKAEQLRSETLGSAACELQPAEKGPWPHRGGMTLSRGWTAGAFARARRSCEP